MRIHAQVCWFDEPAEHFERLAASLVGLADSALLMDGAYADYPHDSPQSPSEQWDAAYRAFALRGIEVCTMGCTTGGASGMAWPSQTVKRTAMWQAMLDLPWVQPGDYALIIDADEHVVMHGSPHMIRHVLAGQQPDTARVALNTPATDQHDPSLHGVHSPANSTSRNGRSVPRIMHLARDMVVGPKHHGSYTATSRDGARRVRYKARGSEHAHLPMAESLDLSEMIEIRNETWSRAPARLQAKHVYGLRRERRGIDL